MRYNKNASQDVMSIFTQDFEFPYSYKNLRYSYPTLMLVGATKATKVKQGFMYPLCIDRIILKSKEE